MAKFAIFVFADPQTKEGLGRVVNAMESVKELDEAGHKVRLYFDGYGTACPAALSSKDHIAHDLFDAVKGNIEGACAFCATAFGTRGGVEQCRVRLVDEYDQHISIAGLVSDGYHIMNF
ncbi:MAG: hypothetical protein WAO91_04725 [Candidatus Nitrosotenuis sp.]